MITDELIESIHELDNNEMIALQNYLGELIRDYQKRNGIRVIPKTDKPKLSDEHYYAVCQICITMIQNFEEYLTNDDIIFLKTISGFSKITIKQSRKVFAIVLGALTYVKNNYGNKAADDITVLQEMSNCLHKINN